MGRIASIDGELFAPEDAKVSVYDRGFLYGDSVFETVRTYGGAPFAMDEHLVRLERSAERVAIEVPVAREVIEGEVLRAIAAAGNPESSARIMLTRGSGPLGLDPSLATRALRVVLVEPLSPLPGSMYRDGVAVIAVKTERAADAAHGAKVGNYLASLLALRAAREAGAHEALVLGASGQVLEGTTSNVFVVRGGALVTPPEEAGILAGITRAHVLALAMELGIPVRFELLSVDDTVGAEEVFLTSSLREVLPVVRVDGTAIGGGRPGPVTQRLHAAYRRKVGLGAEPMPWER